MNTLRWKANKQLHNEWASHNITQTTPDILFSLLGCWRQHHLLPVFSRDGKEGTRLHLLKYQMTVWPLKCCHGKQLTKSTMATIQNNLVSPTRWEGREKREWEVNLHTCGLWILIWKKKKNHLKRKCVDFPGGPVVKNLPASSGSIGSIPGLGRSHMTQGNKARELHHWSPRALDSVLCSKRSPRTAAREEPLLATLEKARKQQWRLGTAKIK